MREQALHDKPLLWSVREMCTQNHGQVLFTQNRSCWNHTLLEGNFEELLEAKFGPVWEWETPVLGWVAHTHDSARRFSQWKHQRILCDSSRKGGRLIFVEYTGVSPITNVSVPEKKSSSEPHPTCTKHISLLPPHVESVSYYDGTVNK